MDSTETSQTKREKARKSLLARSIENAILLAENRCVWMVTEFDSSGATTVEFRVEFRAELRAPETVKTFDEALDLVFLSPYVHT